MNYWADYERVLSVMAPVTRVLRDVRSFGPQDKSNSTRKYAMKLLKQFMAARDKFYKYASTGDYMAQLLLMTDIHWSKKLYSSHLCLNMQPRVLGIAPDRVGDVVLKMSVLTRYQMLSNPLYEAERSTNYPCVPVLHTGKDILIGARWDSTPQGWVYPGGAAKEVLEGLAIKWENMSNFINEKELGEITLPHEAMWLVQRCVQEHKVRRLLAKCERHLIRKLASMMFGKNYQLSPRPLIAPQSATLDDGSLLTLGLPAVFKTKVDKLSDMQLGLFTALKISAAIPSVAWGLGISGPHVVSREKLLLDREC